MLPNDQFYIPDGASISAALSRTTHLGIAAHPDDLEIMASPGILDCYGRKDRWFFGVILTDGAGSPRSGVYQSTTDGEMVEIRRSEQMQAAELGEYSGVAFLSHSSAELKSSLSEIVHEIQSIVEAARPQIIYAHNPADRHETHVAAALRTIQALRNLPMEMRPERLLGCEVWGSLDWLPEKDRVILTIPSHLEVASSLLAVHRSQNAGGKRYDAAARGRWSANATFNQSHQVDQAPAVSLAMDLTPLIAVQTSSINDYLAGIIDRFKETALDRIEKMKGGVAK